MRLAQVEKIYQAIQKSNTPDQYKKEEGDGRFFASVHEQEQFLSNLRIQDIEGALSWLDDRANKSVSQRDEMRRVIGEYRFATSRSLQQLRSRIHGNPELTDPALSRPIPSAPTIVIDVPTVPVPDSSQRPTPTVIPPGIAYVPGNSNRVKTPKIKPGLPPIAPAPRDISETSPNSVAGSSVRRIEDPIYKSLREGNYQPTVESDGRYHIHMAHRTVSLAPLHADLVSKLSTIGRGNLLQDQYFEPNYDERTKNLILRVRRTGAKEPHLTLLISEKGQVSALPLSENSMQTVISSIIPAYIRTLSVKEQNLVNALSRYSQNFLNSPK